MPSTKGKSRTSSKKKKRKEISKKKATDMEKELAKRMEFHKNIMESSKKLTVHQDPRSEQAARIRHMRDQPRKKLPKSPHRDIYKKVEHKFTLPEKLQRYPKISYSKGGSVKLAKKYFKGGMV
mgnify:FL=1